MRGANCYLSQPVMKMLPISPRILSRFLLVAQQGRSGRGTVSVVICNILKGNKCNSFWDKDISCWITLVLGRYQVY